MTAWVKISPGLQACLNWSAFMANTSDEDDDDDGNNNNNNNNFVNSSESKHNIN